MRHLLRIGTRRSALARWQTDHVAHLLRQVWPDLEVEIVTFTTRGDRELAKPLPEIGGKGLFTAELEAALRSGEIDLAVHSLKDLPTASSPDLTLGAVLSRVPPHDVLVSRHGVPLDALPPNPTIGTSSTRRAAQLRLVRPDARVIPLRGNVDTRVRKALDPDGPYDAVILARAGLTRIGLEEHITQVLPFDIMLPAPGQGALAVQCRAGDERVLRYLQPLEDPDARAATAAERAFLQALGGGCARPVAALGEVRAGTLHLRGLYVAGEGEAVRVRGEARPEEAVQLGERLAAQVLERISASGTRAAPPSNPLPLQGKRVLVTRPEDQAEPLVQQLRSLGATPVLYPTIRIAPPADRAPLEAALRRLAAGEYHWLVLTSANGVRFLWDRWRALGLGDALPEGVRVAAIGPATAAALQERGITPDLMPAAFVAEALAEALGDVRGQRLLLARADIARATLREELTARGAHVDEVTAYRTLIAPPPEPPPPVDIITFTSPSAVRGFTAALGDAGTPDWITHARVACIGPITAQTARKLGLEVDVVAEEYTVRGLVEALVQALSPAQPGTGVGPANRASSGHSHTQEVSL